MISVMILSAKPIHFQGLSVVLMMGMNVTVSAALFTRLPFDPAITQRITENVVSPVANRITSSPTQCNSRTIGPAFLSLGPFTIIRLYSRISSSSRLSLFDAARFTFPQMTIGHLRVRIERSQQFTSAAPDTFLTRTVSYRHRHPVSIWVSDDTQHGV
jgi:hypothetical protein